MVKQEQKILDTVGRILSDWGMMMVEPIEEDAESAFVADGPVFRGSLEFRGPTKGRYEVVCQEAFAKNLAANLLAKDVSEVDTEDALEVLRELVNIVSGNLVTTMFGEEQIYTLSPPQVAVSSKEICIEDMRTYRIALCAGDFEPVGFMYIPE